MAQHFAHQIFQAVLVGVGTGKPRSNLGAVDRFRHDAKGVAEHGEVEPPEVENLDEAGIGQQPLQVGCIGCVRRNLHHVGRTVAG